MPNRVLHARFSRTEPSHNALDYFALLLPVLLIIGLFAGLVLLKRYLFADDKTPAPIPIPDAVPGKADPTPNAAPPSPVQQGNNGPGITLTPARLYQRAPLNATQTAVFARLLKALPGYVVLPKITYDHFLEARDGSSSENTSLQNRAGQQLADFLICDKKLRVLLVCQIEDGSHLPARIQERQKMLEKAGLRLLRWNIEQAPDPDKLLKTVQTLEKIGTRGSRAPTVGDQRG